LLVFRDVCTSTCPLAVNHRLLHAIITSLSRRRKTLITNRGRWCWLSLSRQDRPGERNSDLKPGRQCVIGVIPGIRSQVIPSPIVWLASYQRISILGDQTSSARSTPLSVPQCLQPLPTQLQFTLWISRYWTLLFYHTDYCVETILRFLYVSVHVCLYLSLPLCVNVCLCVCVCVSRGMWHGPGFIRKILRLGL